MPVTLAQLASNTASVALSVGGETVTVTYYPGRVTEKVIAQFEAFGTLDASTMTEGFAGFNAQLAHLIKSWDVLEDDGATMFPIEAQRLAELPLGFRIQVLAAIMGDLRPEAMAPQLSQNGAH